MYYIYNYEYKKLNYLNKKESIMRFDFNAKNGEISDNNIYTNIIIGTELDILKLYLITGKKLIFLMQRQLSSHNI